MPPPAPIPTLEDVARAAGVSTATVSRCLNTSEKVSETSRSKVMKAVEQLGYTPNFGARAMASKRTKTIGAIIPTMDNAIFARGLEAFQLKLRAFGYNLLVSSSAYQPDIEAEQIKAMVARGAEGLLLIGHERDQAIYDYLSKRRIPTLISWAHQSRQGPIAIGFDNRAAMRDLALTVLSMGHRNLAVISGVTQGNDRASERVQGILDAAKHHGLDADALPIIEATYTLESGGDAFEKLMHQTPRPTVVMCGNDVLAAGAIDRARDMNISVPDDVSITGFDDIELAHIVTPKLTTVRVPHQIMGEKAAVALVDLVEGKGTAFAERLITEICLRDSLRAP